MRKFFTIFTALCLTLVIGISLIGCGGGDNPPPENPGPEQPAYVSITEDDWYKVVNNSNARNVTVIEFISMGQQPLFKIADTKVAINPDGVHPYVVEDRDIINKTISLFDFYCGFQFSKFTFNGNNDTYAYADSVTIDVPTLEKYSDSSMLSYTYSNIVVKLAKLGDELFISEISLDRVINYEGYSSASTPITLKYSNFGSTIAMN